MIDVMARAVVSILLHTETVKMAEKQEFQEEWEKSFWVWWLVDRIGRSGHQKHRYYFLAGLPLNIHFKIP